MTACLYILMSWSAYFDMRLYFSVVHVFVVDIVMNKYVNVM